MDTYEEAMVWTSNPDDYTRAVESKLIHDDLEAAGIPMNPVEVPFLEAA